MFTFSITEMRAVLDRGRALPSIADVLKASELSSSITTSSRSTGTSTGYSKEPKRLRWTSACRERVW